MTVPMPTDLYKKHQACCDRRSEVLCEENGIQYKLINCRGHEIAKIKVDGGVFSSDVSESNEHKKCDWLLVDCDEVFGILVELKGTDCQTAIKQIDETLNQMKNDLDKCQIRKVHGRIAMRSTKHTGRVSSEKVRLERKLKSDFRGTLKIRNSPFEDTF